MRTLLALLTFVWLGNLPLLASVPEEIVEILEVNCYGCHADGEAEGNFEADSLLRLPLGDDSRDHWHRVLKNVRSQIMPPADSGAMEPDELATLTRWIGRNALGLDPNAPDPGRVTLRRLNRVEYRNTIRDLVGVDYETDVEFPADDSGHGFDNIGDALSMSPLLMEKYLTAAEQIVAEAVPMEPWTSPRQQFVESEMVREFREDVSDDDAPAYDGNASFFEPQMITVEFDAPATGTYRVVPEIEIDHGFEYSPGRAELTIQFDDQTLYQHTHGWSDGGKLDCSKEVSVTAGRHRIQVIVRTTNAEKGSDTSLRFAYERLLVDGPMNEAFRTRPENWHRFFDVGDTEDEWTPGERARLVVKQFGRLALRRPLTDELADALVRLVADDLNDDAITFERSMAKAFVAILSSPRFVFREEYPAQVSAPSNRDNEPAKSWLIDEYSLASRLSYFLWSTMPDDELLELAGQNRLRANLDEQVDRMLADDRRDSFVTNFVGQWLKTRDIESIPMDVLGAAGLRPEYDALRSRLREVFNERREIARRDDVDPEVAEQESRDYREYEVRLLLKRIRELRDVRDELNTNVRRDLRRQTERLFAFVLDEDRNVLELIDNDYEFLNRRLADYYDVDLDDKDWDGDELRHVSLPEDRRGGILRQANFLIVTSNPTRTSPVKRGLFILDNILGTPAPPAPAAVPELEEAADAESDHEPALRELLERHRQDPLCASCHRRFDPMGLALENYSAIGQWRDEDAGQPIDPSGELISGESFSDADELMEVLTGPRRVDFYRCLTEKIMTYALGRGIEYYDEPTIDTIVGGLEADGQRPTIRRIIRGILGSAAFQRMRAD